ncbi:hypothetical protein DFH07DRAFT_728528 [Mycena maculata]|uniref:Uncharacterized protein n=1 Tax=Mycena maculata TaxID=230809 RepID=A0AAD7KAQ9_9AGAR|nr:hypothetical protein DFH07DRAFT_728528 [Mycena maculata]
MDLTAISACTTDRKCKGRFDENSVLAVCSARPQWWVEYLEAVDFESIQEIVAHCKNEHGEDCRTSERLHVSNLRVFNCKIETLEAATMDTGYIALSYVRGTGMEDHRPLTTIEDAKKMVLRLGYTYLFVH